MTAITHKKIAGLEPRWARYAGFSILFDNPGESLHDSGRDRRLQNPLNDAAQTFYVQLRAALQSLDCESLRRSQLLCPLPPESYHVTVWDGVRSGNLATVRPELHDEWSEFLAGLPASLSAVPPSMAAVTNHDLLRVNPVPMTFCFDRLHVVGEQALVIALRVSEESEAAWSRLVERRNALGHAAERELGIVTQQPFSPHVTLGYFANEDHGQRATAREAEWNAVFQDRVTSTIRFTALGVYGYTDMASFYRL